MVRRQAGRGRFRVESGHDGLGRLEGYTRTGGHGVLVVDEAATAPGTAVDARHVERHTAWLPARLRTGIAPPAAPG